MKGCMSGYSSGFEDATSSKGYRHEDLLLLAIYDAA